MDVSDLVKGHEGLRLMPYKDTVGKVTIGYGRNLTAKGISNDEANLMFENDLQTVLGALEVYPWYRACNEARQAVLADMAFNLGIAGLLKFRTMIGCLVVGDYKGAAAAMRVSTWAGQVKTRAVEDCAIMETGQWLALPANS